MSPDRLAEMHRFVDERYTKIAAFVSAGYTRKEAAQEFKVSEGTIMAACKRHNVEPVSALRAKKESAAPTSSEQTVETESDDREIERRLDRIDGALEPGHKLTWGVLNAGPWPGCLRVKW